MGEISHLGSRGIFFYNSGAVTFCLLYFIYQYCIKPRGGEPIQFFWARKDGTTNWRALACVFANCFVIVGIFYAVLISLGLAIQAGINIGLVISIWAIGPFLAALLDLFVYRVPMKTFHIIGMIAMMACAVLIALSGGPPPEEAADAVKGVVESIKEVKDLIPAWIPIVFAPVMPTICTA
jgi:drug/metabolite transporter (DMT)-like permease